MNDEIVHTGYDPMSNYNCGVISKMNFYSLIHLLITKKIHAIN